jgi:hypothetical protein
VRVDRDWIAGSLLVVLGVVLLGERVAPELVPLLPLVIGLAALVLFFIVRSGPLLVLGGVLTGLGIGVLIARGSGSDLAAAGFLGSIGVGFLLAWIIGLWQRVPRMRWWPFVVGVALVALGVVVGALGIGPKAMQVAIDWWPLAVIALGAYLLWAVRADRLARASPAPAAPELTGEDAARAIRVEAARRIAEQHEPPPLEHPGADSVEPAELPGDAPAPPTARR